jgi:ABC-type transport system involved in multi-copper enzyme maturation permease subunit
MIRYLLQTHLKNKVLWAWPGIMLLFVSVFFIWGDVSASEKGLLFFLHLGDLKIPSSIVLTEFLVSIITLIAIIGLPSPLAENLDPKRASLLLSKPISRTQMFVSHFSGVLLLSLIYMGITVFLLGALTIIKGGFFPVQALSILLIFVPLIIIAYYVTISLFLVLSNSYLAGVILGYFFTGFSGLFLDSDRFLEMLGWQDTSADIIISFFSYLIPSADGFNQIMNVTMAGGYSTFNGSLFVFALSTLLPFALLSYYFFQKKEF